MAEAKEKHAPIRQSVRVDCPIEDAFRLFTEGFSEWWPLGEHCAIEPWAGGRVFANTPSGEEREWGSVTTWDPPRKLQLRAENQTVDIDFSVVADGTLVTLTHTGWEQTSVQASILEQCLAQFVSNQMLVMA